MPLSSAQLGEEIVQLLHSSNLELVAGIRKALRQSKVIALSQAEITSLLLRLNFSFSVGEPRLASVAIENLTLGDLIRARVLFPPIELFKEFKTNPHKGAIVRATITTDGQIEFEGELFDKLDRPAKKAYESVTNREKKNVNGWDFWSCSVNGITHTLNQWRQEAAIRLAGDAPPTASS